MTIYMSIYNTIVTSIYNSPLYPGVIEKLNKVAPSRVVLLANHECVGFRRYVEENYKSSSKLVLLREIYSDADVVEDRVDGVLNNLKEGCPSITFEARSAYQALLQGVEGAYMHPDGEREWSHNWRMPRAGMLYDATPDDLFVGSCHRDKVTARRAGVKFKWSRLFFGPGK